MRMGNAIASLHFGASTESVGEAFVSATYSGQGFRYQPQAFLAAEHDQVVEEGPWVPANWGTVAEGGFGYGLLVPTEPGVGLIGLYFAHAGLGLVYHPLVQDEAFTYSGVSREAFREAILRDHGVSVDGPHLPSA